MPTNNRESEADSAASRAAGTGPGERAMRAGAIIAVALYLVLISVLVLYGLVKLWPHPTPSGEPKEDAQANSSPGPTGSPASVTPSPAATVAVVAAQPTAGTSPETTTTTGATTTSPGQRMTPSPSPTVTPPRNGRTKLPDPEAISFFRGAITANIYAETRLLLLVMLAGALGSLMHALRSLYWYTGNRLMVWSWAAFYFLLPFTGAMLAVIFYFVVRGGFFSPQASFENTSPFGFAALSALVGLFSPQATLKLKEVAETIFTKPGAGADHMPQESDEVEAATRAPTISLVKPSSGAGAAKVTIAGTGFVEGVEVKFGGLSAEVTSSSSTAIEVVTPTSASAPASVDVEVSNPGGQTATLSKGYTYLADGGGGIPPVGTAVEKPVHGEGGDDELIDGCDVELKADTGDEELPITEGGVK